LRTFLASAAGTLLLDQITKAVVRAQMAPRVAIRLLGDFARLRYIHNAGTAFGLFQGARILLIAISVLSAGVVVYLVASGRYRFRGSRVAFGLVLGGALGNLVDRFVLHEVVDFIDVGIGLHRWPTFNVADIGITLGVLYLALAFLAGEWGARAPAGAGESVPAPGSGETRVDG
jgi:signal peptidase II